MLFQLYSVALQHLLFILYPSHIPGAWGSFTRHSKYNSYEHTPSLALTANTGTEGSKDRQVHSQCPKVWHWGPRGEGNKWTSLLNIVFYNLQQSLE